MSQTYRRHAATFFMQGRSFTVGPKMEIVRKTEKLIRNRILTGKAKDGFDADAAAIAPKWKPSIICSRERHERRERRERRERWKQWKEGTNLQKKIRTPTTK